MTRLQALVILAVLMIVGPDRAALACSCMAYPADEAQAVAVAWPKADVIFLGKVTAIKSGIPGASRWRGVTLEVEQRWKGLPEDLPVVVRTASNSAACGYPYDLGRSYVVFAYRNPANDQLTTNLCALNKRRKHAEGVMRELDQVKRSAVKAR